VNGYTGPTGVIPLFDEQVRIEADKGFATTAVSCDVIANPLHNSVPEITTNIKGQSCGQPMHFNVDVSSSGVTTLITNQGVYGTQEGVYLGGTWTQALACHWMEVRNEIIKNHTLKNAAPECQAMAQSYQNLMAQSTTVSSQVTNLAQQANITDIWNCNGTSSTDQVKQSSQYLCTGRAAIEKLFTHVAYCEATYRAEKAYRQIAPDPATFMDTIKTTVMKTCNEMCTNQCSGCTSPLTGAASRCSSCGTSCANQCYPQQLLLFYQKELAPLPSNGNCSL
jgi:hypothetical protein